MGKRTPKTKGSEWLYLSMASFNGSGYADKSSPEAYVKSYMFFKAWKKQKDAIEVLKKYELEAFSYAMHLVEADDAGHTPSDKNYQAFQAFCDRSGLLI